jgi:urease accessory protein
MIKKVTVISKGSQWDDTVELGWFDMQKPNLTATTDQGIDFIIKTKFTHLHEGDVLSCDDGYAIAVKKAHDAMHRLHFNNHLDFATVAYEIGNRHQPITIEDHTITVLQDIALEDIIKSCKAHEGISVESVQGYFKPNGKAHHSH